MSPLEVPLEVKKEMEIAWRKVRAVGRMGENLKLQRLQSINRMCVYRQQLSSVTYFKALLQAAPTI